MNACTELKELKEGLQNFIADLDKYKGNISMKKVKARLNKIIGE